MVPAAPKSRATSSPESGTRALRAAAAMRGFEFTCSSDDMDVLPFFQMMPLFGGRFKDSNTFVIVDNNSEMRRMRL